MRPYSDSILKILGSAIKDKSPAVRKSYAVAVGYLCRLTTDAGLVKFMERLDGYYLGVTGTGKEGMEVVVEDNNEELLSIAAITTREISKNASDRFKGVASSILPTVFYGTFDNNKDISGIWKEVWEEHTTGSSSSVKLHAREILKLLSVQMTSASWKAKKQSAAALKAVAEIMDLSDNMDTLLPLVLEGLSGRTWDGKEQVVEALPALAISAKKGYFRSQTAPGEAETGAGAGAGAAKLPELAKVLLRESQKKVNKRYRRHAIDALGTFLDAFPELDYYQEVEKMLFTILDNDVGGNGDEDEDDEHEKPLQLMVMASAARALGMAWTTDAKHQAEKSSEFASHVCKALVRNIWNVRSALLSTLEKFFAKLDVTTAGDFVVVSDETMVLILDSLVEGALRDFKYIQLRNQGLDIVKAVIEKLENTRYYTPVVIAKLKQVLGIVRKDPVPSISEVAAVLEMELKE
ncbi:proteasome component M29 [Podila humilis]|nr:proteasome component M29 [Podila humilis]